MAGGLAHNTPHTSQRYISPICPEAPRQRICTKIGIAGRLANGTPDTWIARLGGQLPGSSIEGLQQNSFLTNVQCSQKLVYNSSEWE